MPAKEFSVAVSERDVFFATAADKVDAVAPIARTVLRTIALANDATDAAMGIAVILTNAPAKLAALAVRVSKF